MSVLVNCPHCSTRVLPMPGQVCPACRKNVDAPPDPKPKPAQVEPDAYKLAAEQMLYGVAPSRIKRTLTERGLDADAAATVVEKVDQARTSTLNRAGKRNMLFGASWCIGGIAVTAITYEAASQSGGTYLIAWGAILFGGIQFLHGLFQSASE
jgi:hypothetical protein